MTEQITTTAAAVNQPVTPTGRAWAIARGAMPPVSEEAAAQIWGGQNDYNSRGRGSTSARRVLRNGSWHWVAAPTSRGRVRAADRHHTTHGDVWEGEIVARYTLGSRTPSLESFCVVTGGDTTLIKLVFAALSGGGYRLRLIAGSDVYLDVPDPAWR